MNTMKFKVTGHAFGVTPQGPYAKPGWDKRGRVLTYEVTDIPDGKGMPEVMDLFNTTCIVPTVKRYSFKYSELGRGRIIRV